MTGCFVVLQLWIHPILLHLLPVPIAYSLIKRGIKHFGSSEQIRDLGHRILDFISAWIETRSDVVVPKPAKFVWKELGRLKRAVLQGLFTFWHYSSTSLFDQIFSFKTNLTWPVDIRIFKVRRHYR